MIKIFKCRRSSLALIGMTFLTYLGVKVGLDVSTAIGMVCMGVAGANAYQGKPNA